MAIAPHPLILLHEDVLFRARVRDAVPSVLRLVEVPSWTDLRRAVLLAPPGSVALVDPYAGQMEGSLAPELAWLRRDFPVLPILAAARTRAPRPTSLPELEVAGVGGVEGVDVGVSAAELRRRLTALRTAYVARFLGIVLPAGLPARTRALLQDAAEVAAAQSLAEDWAEVLGISTRTLLRRCALAGLPPPRRLLSWMRVLLAVELLESPAHSVATAAVACGYAADLPLRRAITRLTGTPPPLLLRQGGVRAAAERLARDLAAHRGPGER